MASVATEALARLSEVPGVSVVEGARLDSYTRFALGGPALALVDSSERDSFIKALRLSRASGLPVTVIGGGTNLIVSDDGFPGIVLRYTGDHIAANATTVTAGSGAVLQHLVDFCNAHGLEGLQTMTGIPGWVGGAVYGNAGAYGHSISERVRRVVFFDGERIREIDNLGCEFRYRESVFKRNKTWLIFEVEMEMSVGDAAELQKTASDILNIRNAKYPPDMKCAGSIFKNLILAELPADVQKQVPAKVIREGKVPSAWFLEQVGAKGESRGDIKVAEYHANLIYNAGHGSARELRALIADLGARVRDRFRMELEEEVRFVGFE